MHCFPKVNGISALPLAKALCLFSKSFIHASEELLPEGAWKTFQVGRGTVPYAALKSGHSLTTALLLAGVELWVSSDWGGGKSGGENQKEVNYQIHMEGLHF